MSRARSHKPPHPNNDVPEEFEPGVPPVEHDEGAIPALRQVAASPRGARAPGSAVGLALPHERDESSDATAVAPDPMMVQAKRDIEAGLVDTDMRATPGLDARRRSRLVPGPGGKPPRP